MVTNGLSRSSLALPPPPQLPTKNHYFALFTGIFPSSFSLVISVTEYSGHNIEKLAEDNKTFAMHNVLNNIPINVCTANDVAPNQPLERNPGPLVQGHCLGYRRVGPAMRLRSHVEG